ncbi:extracellular solute-binding protein [Treponema parvum]|uniref:Extracellular solute-binding protein n=1 Tax=Treponema parvum TaxID=138851 RepID=A0A975IFD8_9SPIR|nr:extracellular solute-binding protein [Treponema parvum]QTQ14881.1 extracellular solute-binding protein [Treponema parvum]
MKLTRFSAAALAIAMGAALFASGANEKQAGGPVTINLWYGAAVTEAGPPPAGWEVQKIIKEKFDIDLVLTALPSSDNDQDQKINAASAANELPDLFMVSRPVWLRLVDQGLVAPVDDMYEKMPNRKTHYGKDSIMHTTIDGKSYGLASPGSIIRNEGLVIRKDWLDRLGLKAPTNLDEMMKVMEAFTFNDPDGNGKNDTYGYGAFLENTQDTEGLGRRLEPIMGAFGLCGTWDMSAKNPGLKIFRPEYFEALSYVKQMCDKKVIDPNWLSYKKDDFRAAWKQGRFGMMREQNSALASKNNYAPFDKNFPNGEWMIIDPPKGPNGLQSAGNYSNNYRIYAISESAAAAGKKDAIAKLLNWMSDEGPDGGYYMIGWGKEGVNFIKDSNGIPTTKGIPDPTKAWSNSEIVNITQLRNMVFYNGAVEIKARYPAYTTDVSKKIMDPGAILINMQSRPWENSNGISMMPPPNADVKRFLEQGVLEFLTGKRQLTRANWDAWVKNFKDIGGQAWNDAGVAEGKKKNIFH